MYVPKQIGGKVEKGLNVEADAGCDVQTRS
jgi:hypothetical protein